MNVFAFFTKSNDLFLNSIFLEVANQFFREAVIPNHHHFTSDRAQDWRCLLPIPLIRHIPSYPSNSHRDDATSPAAPRARKAPAPVDRLVFCTTVPIFWRTRITKPLPLVPTSAFTQFELEQPWGSPSVVQRHWARRYRLRRIRGAVPGCGNLFFEGWSERSNEGEKGGVRQADGQEVLGLEGFQGGLEEDRWSVIYFTAWLSFGWVAPHYSRTELVEEATKSTYPYRYGNSLLMRHTLLIIPLLFAFCIVISSSSNISNIASDAMQQIRLAHPYIASSVKLGLIIGGTAVLLPTLGVMAWKRLSASSPSISSPQYS